MKKDRPKYKQIIDAAVIVIAENGYHQAQISKIARQAGVADGTIYLYFENKEDLLVSVFLEKMGVITDRVRESVAGKKSAVEKLYVMIETHFRHLSADRHFAILTQLEVRQPNKELRMKINEAVRPVMTIIDDIISTGIEQGELSPDLDIRVARQVIFGAMDETATTWVINDQRYDLVAVAPKVHKILLHGLSSK